jgi:rod shape determining protein RodA
MSVLSALPAPRAPEALAAGRRLSGAIRSLLVSSIVLALSGIAAIHSASAEFGTAYLPRQSVWVVLGLVVMAIAALLDYHFILRLAIWLYAVGVVAVVLILLVGHEAGGARSWVGVAGLGGQPSDFAKLATVFLLTQFLGGVRLELLEMRHLLVAGVIVGIPVGLIAMQPDLGGAAMFLPILVGSVFVAGVQLRVVLTGLAIVLVLGGGLFFFGMQDYQRDRILSFVSPGRDPLGAGYQIRQSKIAVGSGAVLGKGYMQGTQSQLRFLPARHTDFVFAVVAEESGFLGVAFIMGLYGVWMASGLRIALRARDRQGLLLATGLLSAIAAHVLYNTGMVIGLVPVTGIPLPFLSYGGSFTLFSFAATGFLIGIDRRRYVNRARTR